MQHNEIRVLYCHLAEASSTVPSQFKFKEGRVNSKMHSTSGIVSTAQSSNQIYSLRSTLPSTRENKDEYMCDAITGSKCAANMLFEAIIVLKRVVYS